MCELLGISAKEPFRVNSLLDSFYNHSYYNKDGWGLAVFYGAGVSVEKEAVRAVDSSYLRQRLTRDINASNLFAHIRKATLGRIEYANCHPFIYDDQSGRTWTLIHNGTLFNGGNLSRFVDLQEGSTDSERILMYIIEQMDDAYSSKGEKLSFYERFDIIDDIVNELSDGNKLNMLLYDGEYMYVHTNSAKSLYEWTGDLRRIFATKPVAVDGWEPLPMNRIMAYKSGELIRTGHIHNNEFFDEEHDYESLLSAYAEL